MNDISHNNYVINNMDIININIKIRYYDIVTAKKRWKRREDEQ